ncbi:SIS domain-containing protein [Candidatus Pacearchaeota archaeon]|nr:SIS domain-containing protein [Candidatus Pacearchaeota archaeon]
MKRGETRDLVELYLNEQIEVNKQISRDKIVKIADLTWETYLGNGSVFVFANGGGGAYAGNLACDFANHPFVSDDKSRPMDLGVRRLKAFDLTTSAENMTGIMNDLGPDYIFSQQLLNAGVRQGDLVYGFSGSGNSPNVLEAFKVARENGAKTISMTRGDGGKVKALSDICLVVPGTSKFPGQIGGNDNNMHFEDACSYVTHIVTGILRKRVNDTYALENDK